MVGKIIVIEGTDCSGKETQAKLLEKKLNDMGIKCIRFGFPMYNSPTGRIVGECYLGRNGKSFFPEGAVNVNPMIASLYYAADRKYNIEKANKYLNEGYYVILDRYVTSNLAHQGSKIHNKEERFNMYQWIDKLEYWLLKLPKPDITIFLHLPLRWSLELRKNRNILDEHEKDEEYLQNAEEAYVELAELYNWQTVECVKNDQLLSIEEINEQLINVILKSNC